MALLPKILLVDDDESIRELLSDVLEMKNYQIKTAENGKEAIDIIQKEKIDLVITDLQMHGIDGMKLLEYIQTEFPEVLVIIISAYGTIETTVKALKKGAYNFISKPIQIHEFIKMIDKVSEKINLIKRNYLVHHYSKDILQFKIPSKIEFVQGVSDHLQKTLDNMGYERNMQSRMVVPFALEEALKNAVEHGNMKNETKKIYIECHVDDEKVNITVEDEGKGFDISQVPDPIYLEQIDNSEGRGLLLIKCYMDEVYHNDKGNKITMIKYKKAKQMLN
jgi:YesN/AraC family two-component response regulator